MITSSDQEILQAALDWLKQNHKVTLVTVLETWGSSPRPPGSLLAIRDDGLHAGSVSGGCIEEDLFDRAKQNQLADDSPTTLAYGSGEHDYIRSGLPCGGRLELLIESLQNQTQLQTILRKIAAGELLARRVCLSTGEVSLHSAQENDDFLYRDDAATKVFGPAWKLLLIGAGHLSQYVSQIARMLDYHVRVCDPRKEYQQAWPLEEIEVLSIMPDDAVGRLSKHQRCIVLALAHDPKLDDMALLQALTLHYFYVGALGSKRSNDKRRHRLTDMGLTPQQIKRLHGPVGLAIGSHTPAEIAVSIMADITAARNCAMNHHKKASAA